MKKRILSLVIAVLLCFLSVAYAEDYSIYTTEHLQQMKSEIEAELEKRGTFATEETIGTEKYLYQDNLISITLLNWRTESKKLYTTISFANIGDQYYTIMPNCTDEMTKETDGLKAIRKMKEIGSGKMYYSCPPGETLECEFVWDLKEIYDISFYASLLPESPEIQKLCSLISFPAGYHIGITCVIAPSEMISSEIILGTDNNDKRNITEILNIQIEAISQ